MLELAVLGNPIEHSLSPIIHNFFAKETNIQISYEKILVQDEFESFINTFKKHAYGCNVTIPFKEDAYKIADKLSDEAKIAKAVNTLLFKDNIIYGHNTDGLGLILDFKDKGISLLNKKILLIGAGGASLGILKPLFDSNILDITLVNRTKEKALYLRDYFVQEIKNTKDIFHVLSLDSLNNNLDLSFDIIINASASSLYNELPNISDAILKKAHCVYDLMYTKDGDTIFTKHCRELNVQHSIQGLGMLIRQAALSFELWTEKKVNTLSCEQYMLSYLKENR